MGSSLRTADVFPVVEATTGNTSAVRSKVGRGEKKTRWVTRTVFKFFVVVVCLFLLSFFEYPLIGASAYHESGIFRI